jgi:biofilm PGA synthesis N-glycosyltransferase PgaC
VSRTAFEELLRAPTVSVVLAAYNEEREILNALAEVQKQTFQDFEILVIDDGSTDGTFRLATEHLTGRPGSRVIRSDHLGPAHAYNVGINAAKGDIVFIAESDCVYDRDYLEQAVRELKDRPDANAVCLTGGPLIVRSTVATECILIENLVQHQQLKEGKIKPFYAWVFRRDAIKKVGGYDESLHQAEDKDLFRRFTRAGNKVAWVPGIHWQHKRDITLTQLSIKSYKRGRSRALFAAKHRLFSDIARKLGPISVLVAVPIVGFFFPLVGLLLLLAIVAAAVARTLRVISITWSLVKKRKYYLAYPVFLLSRNIAAGLGYVVGFVMIFLRKLRRQEITWQTV